MPNVNSFGATNLLLVDMEYGNSSAFDHTVHPNQGIHINAHDRRGFIPTHNSNPPKWLEKCSVLSRCCGLYNALPNSLRQPLPVDTEPSFPAFKKAVDAWLATVPDQPSSCVDRPKVAASNSIIHQVDYRGR